MSMLGLGGIPERRLDQRNLSQSRAGVGPAPQTGTFVGRLVVIFGTGPTSGLFVYSPSPGIGNLIASITTASADTYGNKTIANAIANYSDASGVAVTLSSDVLQFWSGHLATGWAAQARVSGDTAGDLIITGAGSGQLIVNPAAAFGKTLTANSPGGLLAPMPITLTDATTFTITATGANQASNAWQIPANDANAGTIYRLTVWGTGTEGSTAQGLLIGSGLDGANTRTVTAAALTLSTAFRFKVRIEFHVTATGALGKYDLTGDGSWATTPAPTVANPFAFGSFASGGEAFDTTVAHTVRLNLGWAATVGAPTITTLGSLFERLGP